METKNTLSKIYPILFVICPHLLMMGLILMNRFFRPELAAVACAGIVSGIVAEIFIVREKISLVKYIPKLVVAVVIGVVLWTAGYLFRDMYAEDLFGWGWWYKDWGIMLERALLFIPAVISSAFLAIKAKRPVSHVISLILIDPILQLAMLWYIIDVLLGALPT